MKLPQSPPDIRELFVQISNSNTERLTEIITSGIRADADGRYHHWDKLRHLSPPEGFTSEEWWCAIKIARRTLYRTLPHVDKNGNPFVFAEPDIVRQLLHEIDIHGGGEIKSAEQVANPQTRDTYLINSLIEEAITSSQLEGAATTRNVAREMIRMNRRPTNKSERMIINNYRAMLFISDIASEDLTPELILELHKVLSENTLENQNASGKLRTDDEIYVGDNRDATIIHIPPKASELRERLKSICSFANNSSKSHIFLHPVIRAIVLHFLLAYDHPFEDGNGRTARALFYWSMLKQGYWTMEYISISRILKEAPAKYTRAYLYTETDDNDVTYFIIHQLETIIRAIKELFIYLEKKTGEIKAVERVLTKSPGLKRILNHRQFALLNRALKKPSSDYYVEGHRRSHDVTYDTARTDLLKLADLGLLDKFKEGKAFVFRPAANLREILQNLVE